MKHFKNPNADLEEVEVKPRSYVTYDFFSGMFAEELAKIPPELHDRVAVYVHHHVEARVQDHLSEFRQEIEAQMK